uniref:Tyr recombinase domain-containing protein n=1 Tax=Glossina brevipalpis TaxID=37001 RepID=A0A1A9VZ85_9MUSC
MNFVYTLAYTERGVYTLLTDTKLRKALGKHRDKVEVISNSHGLNVRLSLTGGVTFFYRYRWENKPVQLSIGDYPSITLSHARERRQQFRAWITQGYDPRRQVVLERQQKINAMTVEEAFEYWETYYCKPEGIIKMRQNRRNFENHVMPILDINPIESLRRSDVGMAAAMKDRMLSDDEIRVIWDALDDMPVRQQFVVRFLIMTGCRSTEIRTSKWDWFDYKSKTWTVPACEYKTGRTVRRALPEAAISLLKEHQKGSVTKHVLTPSRYKGPEDDKPPVQPNIAFFSAQIIMKTGMKQWSLHDLRRTVATRLSELGAPPHVIEKLLGHQLGGVMARYNLHDYLDDQHHWLKVWHS